MAKGAIWIVGLVIAASACRGGRMSSASEMAVIRELQRLNTAQVQYKSQFHRFAASMAELGPSAPTSSPPVWRPATRTGTIS
jgi:hypothetical protein